MIRPLFAHGISQLEELFESKGDDAQVLQELREELVYRQTKRAKDLWDRVEADFRQRSRQSMTKSMKPMTT